MTRTLLPFISLALVLASNAPLASQSASKPQRDKQVATKPLGHRVIEVPVRNGRVSLLALSRQLFDAYGLDGSQLRFEDVRLRVTGTRGALTLGALRLVLKDSAKIGGVEDGKKLRIEIDRFGARELRGKFKRKALKWIGRVTGKDLLTRHYELQEPRRLPAGEPMVLLIHGVDSGPRSMTELRDYLETRGFHTGVFAYANDEAIDLTGQALSSKLRDFKKRRPGTPVYIVAHSMGGLVSRWALEMPGLDPGNVKMLVMLGTPNHGSLLASVRFMTDVGHYLKRGGDKDAAMSVLRDGLGEAGWDLRPDSAVLTRLNARQRNPRVAYRLILGTGASLTPKDLAKLKVSVVSASEVSSWTRTTTPWLKKTFDDLDELVAGKGDGAVAVKRGRLKGVEELTVSLGHRSLTKAGEIPKDQLDTKHPVFPRVSGWLEAQRRKDRQRAASLPHRGR